MTSCISVAAVLVFCDTRPVGETSIRSLLLDVHVIPLISGEQESWTLSDSAWRPFPLVVIVALGVSGSVVPGISGSVVPGLSGSVVPGLSGSTIVGGFSVPPPSYSLRREIA